MSWVNILHIHRADPSTPLDEQVAAFNQQISKGLCQGVGSMITFIDPFVNANST